MAQLHSQHLPSAGGKRQMICTVGQLREFRPFSSPASNEGRLMAEPANEPMCHPGRGTHPRALSVRRSVQT